MPTATASVSVEDAVNRRRGDLIELSHSIHAEPELAFAEYKQLRQDAGAGRRARLRDHRGPRRAGHRVSRRLRQRSAGHRHLRRIRRAARDRTCLRAQHHRGLRRRHGAGAGRGSRRPRPDGRAARHAGRGGRRRKSVAAQRRNVRRHRRHGDATSRPDRHRRARARWRCPRSKSATWAGRHTRPSRRIWASTPPTRSPSRRWRSGCCASSSCPARWRTASSPTAGRPPTSSPPAPRCGTRCAPTTLHRCATSRTGWPTASLPVRLPRAATTKSRRPSRRMTS